MNFLKKHYEKVVLGAVLLAVAVTSFLLSLHVKSQRDVLDSQLQAKVTGKQKTLAPVDLAGSVAALTALKAAAPIELAGDHNTVNPLTWVYDANHSLVPIKDRGGAGGLVLEKTNPLNLVVDFIGAAGTGDPYRYQFTITREYEKKAPSRRPTTTSLTEGNRNDLFVLRSVAGPKDAPTSVTIELLDSGEQSTITTNKPFAKVMGFTADLKSELDNRSFTGKRIEDTLTHRNVLYKIVAISREEIVVSAPNGLRTTLKLASAP